MLLAFTGSPTNLPTVTSTWARAAAFTNSAAGRECRPTIDSTLTRRSAMILLRG
jgi:hypothetical protein